MFVICICFVFIFLFLTTQGGQSNPVIRVISGVNGGQQAWQGELGFYFLVVKKWFEIVLCVCDMCFGF